MSVDETNAEAVAQIKILKARYFRLLDTKQWDEWKRLFTEDLRFEAPQDRPDVVDRDRDTFVAGVREVVGNASTVHHGHMPCGSACKRDPVMGVIGV